jgi:hypothetical protein
MPVPEPLAIPVKESPHLQELRLFLAMPRQHVGSEVPQCYLRVPAAAWLLHSTRTAVADGMLQPPCYRSVARARATSERSRDSRVRRSEDRLETRGGSCLL